jgi:hypothetical protein
MLNVAVALENGTAFWYHANACPVKICVHGTTMPNPVPPPPAAGAAAELPRCRHAMLGD